MSKFLLLSGLVAVLAVSLCNGLLKEINGKMMKAADPALAYMSTNPDDVGYHLYPDAKNIDDNDLLVHGNEASISKSRFDKLKGVILLSHGFIQNYTTIFPQVPKNAYLKAGFADKYNIIAVDWGKLSGEVDMKNIKSTLLALPAFEKAITNVYVVAKRNAEFLAFLDKAGYIPDAGKIHLVGQSLGGHISGMTGYNFRKATGKTVGRITATDPASPGFQDIDINERLDPTDAKFIDIVHTNQGVNGYLGPLGTVDFFVNGGGPVQGECLRNIANITDLFCAHNLATSYFAMSITDQTIKACQSPVPYFCNDKNTITFGEFVPQTAKGNYFLTMKLKRQEQSGTQSS